MEDRARKRKTEKERVGERERREKREMSSEFCGYLKPV